MLTRGALTGSGALVGEAPAGDVPTGNAPTDWGLTGDTLTGGALTGALTGACTSTSAVAGVTIPPAIGGPAEGSECEV